MEQYDRHLYINVEDVPVGIDKTADKVLKKVKNILKEIYPSVSGDFYDRVYHIGNNYKYFKTNITAGESVVLPVSMLYQFQA